MVTTFVDTSALFAHLDRDDLAHAAAAALMSELSREGLLVTHNYVVVESIALVERRLGRAVARRLADELLPLIDVVWVDAALHAAAEAAWRTDPTASIVDHVSFEVMRRQGIVTALAFDRDFDRRGFTRPAPSGNAGRHRLAEAPAPYATDTPELVGVAEIASRAGTTVSTLQSWRRRHAASFPRPIADLASGPVWTWSDVSAWLAKPRRTGRPRRAAGAGARS